MNRESRSHHNHNHHNPRDFAPRGFGAGVGGGSGFGPGGPGFGHGFGPGPRGFGGPQRRRKGAARDAILSLLAESELNGYGLIKGIADRTDGSWTPSPGSIYPTLQQLVDEGLIEPTTDDKRSDFRLTDAGRTWVTEHEAELTAVWQGDTRHATENADLRESMGKLFGVIQQFRFAANAEQRAKAVELIDETRKSLYRILGE